MGCIILREKKVKILRKQLYILVCKNNISTDQIKIIEMEPTTTPPIKVNKYIDDRLEACIGALRLAAAPLEVELIEETDLAEPLVLVSEESLAVEPELVNVWLAEAFFKMDEQVEAADDFTIVAEPEKSQADLFLS